MNERVDEAEGFRHTRRRRRAAEHAAQAEALGLRAPARGRERWVVNKLRALNAWYSKGYEGGSHVPHVDQPRRVDRARPRTDRRVLLQGVTARARMPNACSRSRCLPKPSTGPCAVPRSAARRSVARSGPRRFRSFRPAPADSRRLPTSRLPTLDEGRSAQFVGDGEVVDHRGLRRRVEALAERRVQRMRQVRPQPRLIVELQQRHPRERRETRSSRKARARAMCCPMRNPRTVGMSRAAARMASNRPSRSASPTSGRGRKSTTWTITTAHQECRMNPEMKDSTPK